MENRLLPSVHAPGGGFEAGKDRGQRRAGKVALLPQAHPGLLDGVGRLEEQGDLARPGYKRPVPRRREEARAQTWTFLKDLQWPLKSSLYVGLAVTAHDDAQLATTTIDRVSLRGRSKP